MACSGVGLHVPGETQGSDPNVSFMYTDSLYKRETSTTQTTHRRDQ